MSNAQSPMPNSPTMTSSNSLAITLLQRREKLAKLIDFPAIFWSGSPSPRNFSANIFPHRPSSHFLYFAGLPLKNAAIRLEAGKLQLFVDNPGKSSALWHGETPSRDAIAQQIGADEAYPMAELESHLQDVATIAVQDAGSWDATVTITRSMGFTTTCAGKSRFGVS